MSNSEYKPIESKMQKAVDALSTELATLRAGRANPAVLDKVKVNYYGVPTAVNQVANVTVPEARMIVIQPWDSTLLREVEKAIQASDLGINPNNDGKVIRLIFPTLTEERRRDLVKTVKKNGEDTKILVRNIRRDAIEEYKTYKKDGDITEDDLKQSEKDIQEITDKFIAKIDDILKEKEKEIMDV
ncbi:MAG TPA: ribosome recycling factor [Clostridiales bacterium]|nr:ribosome recycling factor [Clostridiales bacterium]